MSDCPGFMFRVEFHNPYRQPPEGYPRRLAEMFSRENTTPPEIAAFARKVRGTGYGISICPLAKPVKQLAPETLAAVRQKRVRRRMSKKYPMFANEFVSQEIERKPDYYLNGMTDADIEAARAEVEARYAEMYERCMRGEFDHLVVYKDWEVSDADPIAKGA